MLTRPIRWESDLSTALNGYNLRKITRILPQIDLNVRNNPTISPQIAKMTSKRHVVSMEPTRQPTQRSESTPEATDELHNDATMEKMAADLPSSYGKLGNRRKCADGSGIEVV